MNNNLSPFSEAVSIMPPSFGRKTELLLIWENLAKAVAFDVAQGRSLGEYQAKGTGEGISGINFSEDGRSVIEKRADGKSEVRQLSP